MDVMVVPTYLTKIGTSYSVLFLLYCMVDRLGCREIGERMLKLINPEQRLRDVGAEKTSPGLPFLESGGWRARVQGLYPPYVWVQLLQN